MLFEHRSMPDGKAHAADMSKSVKKTDFFHL